MVGARRKCVFRGKEFEVRRKSPEGTVTLITLDHGYAQDDGGWERVDKFEWEKTVPVSEVTFLPDDQATP